MAYWRVLLKYTLSAYSLTVIRDLHTYILTLTVSCSYIPHRLWAANCRLCIKDSKTKIVRTRTALNIQENLRNSKPEGNDRQEEKPKIDCVRKRLKRAKLHTKTRKYKTRRSKTRRSKLEKRENTKREGQNSKNAKVKNAKVRNAKREKPKLDNHCDTQQKCQAKQAHTHQ